MSALWRCRVCEGVNQGGRTCGACGAQVPHGESLRVAVKSRLPHADPPAVPPPVPPTPRRRELRETPRPEELTSVDPDELLSSEREFKMMPVPGGCAFSFVPRPDRPRSGDWT